MGKVYQVIDDRLKAFIETQRMFFVATAPADTSGHVNLSPKGLDGLCVAGATRVRYLDYVGSGVETIAHLRENGRIVIMLCALDGPPRIVRLQGVGRVVEPHDAEFAHLAEAFGRREGVRALIDVEVTRISDSCGFGVPRYVYVGDRPHLRAWVAHRAPAVLSAYQREHNARSIDGLGGLRWVEGERDE